MFNLFASVLTAAAASVVAVGIAVGSAFLSRMQVIEDELEMMFAAPAMPATGRNTRRY